MLVCFVLWRQWRGGHAEEPRKQRNDRSLLNPHHMYTDYVHIQRANVATILVAAHRAEGAEAASLRASLLSLNITPAAGGGGGGGSSVSSSSSTSTRCVVLYFFSSKSYGHNDRNGMGLPEQHWGTLWWGVVEMSLLVHTGHD